MANDIERMLELNSKIEKGNIPTKQKTHKVPTQKDLDRLVEDFDRQVYGPTPEPILKENQRKPYKAEEEMKMLKEIEERGGRQAVNLEGRNIPKGIVESILNNPLDLKPIDPKMDALEERLKGNMPGIKAAANILERVDKQDKEARAKLNENIIPKQNGNANIDYDMLRNIIEECIDNKLSQINETM